MKNYDLNIDWGTHIVEVTIQSWEYIGHLKFKIGGNCKGLSVMKNADDLWRNEDVIWNDCAFKIDEDEEWFSCELKDADGNILQCDDNLDNLSDMIVKIEILALQEEK